MIRYRRNIISMGRDDRRESIEQDFILAADTWPIAQLQELLEFDPINQYFTRPVIKRGLIMSAQTLPMPNLLEFYALVRQTAIGGAHNWGVKNIGQRLAAGENPFKMLNEVLERYSDEDIETFDDLDDFLTE